MDFSRYIDFADPDGPRLVGHRIWLFNVLNEHIHNHRRADQLVECYPSLDMEKVYACLLYYEQNKEACQTLVYDELDRRDRRRREDHARHPEKYASLRVRLATRRQGR